MNVDLSYMRNILSVFIGSEKAHLSMDELKDDLINSGVSVCRSENDYNKFISYMHIFMDNKFISDENLHNFELFKPNTKIRLTQKGDDFSKALNNKEVLSKIKSKFNNSTFRVVYDEIQKLSSDFFNKKLDRIISQEQH